MIYLVMGGQAGSEGKGEFTAHLARQLYDRGNLGAVVRTGGPNAGHTFTLSDNTQYKMRQIPCAWHIPEVPLFIGPGSLIDPEVLTQELNLTSYNGFDVDRLHIDPSAVLITDQDKQSELELRASIGSTGEGIGSARSRHVMRRAGFYSPNRPPVHEALNSIYDLGQDIIIESTQGFDLSLVHSGYYPRTTSRDVTPGIILSDAGLSSRLNHRVIAVLRTYPIRVANGEAGSSGPLNQETTFEALGVPEERTTVTNKVRRVGHFDWDQVHRMATICRPDYLCVNFLDYLYPELKDQYLDAPIPLDSPAWGFLNKLITITYASGIGWVSTGPGIITELLPTRGLPV